MADWIKRPYDAPLDDPAAQAVPGWRKRPYDAPLDGSASPQVLPGGVLGQDPTSGINAPAQPGAPNAYAPPIPEHITPHWGDPEELYGALMLSHGPMLMAGATAGEQGLMDILHGGGLSDTWNRVKNLYYPQAHDIYSQAQQQWEGVNPQRALGDTVVGGAAGAIPALAAPEALLPEVGAALSRALPAAGEALAPVGRFLMGRGGGGALAQAASLGAQGARQGATLNLLQGEDPLKGAEYGAPVNALMGTLGGQTARAMDAYINPKMEALDAGLTKQGVNLKAGQLSKEALPASTDTEQLEDYTHAVNQTFGSDSRRASIADWTAAQAQTGAQMGNVAARSPIDVLGVGPNGQSLVGDLSNWRQQAMNDPMIQGQPGEGQLQRIHDQILGSMDANLQIPGTKYQDLTQKDSPLWRAMHGTDPSTALYASKLRDVLDDGVARSNPDAAQEWAFLRGQYRRGMAMKGPIINAEKKGGLVNPNDVATAVKSGYGASPAAGDDLRALAAASGKLKGPTPQGEAPPAPEGPISKFVHSHPYLTLGGASAATGEGLGHFGSQAVELAQEHPVLAGLGGTAALALAALRGGANKLGQSQVYKNMLLGKGGYGATGLELGLRGLADYGPQGATNALINYGQNEGQK